LPDGLTLTQTELFVIHSVSVTSDHETGGVKLSDCCRTNTVGEEGQVTTTLAAEGVTVRAGAEMGKNWNASAYVSDGVML
jgi:hypothetical protein